MTRSRDSRAVAVFDTALGWMAMAGAGKAVRQLTFGHRSPEDALRALDCDLLEDCRFGAWNRPLARRLAAYAAGKRVDFRDVVIDLGRLTEFERRVIRCCRRIPRGRTITYGQLAAAAGSPRAARAVGNCMAANRFPLIVPCHRVVAAGGRIGAYSAPGGPPAKRRLLELEGAAICSARQES